MHFRDLTQQGRAAGACKTGGNLVDLFPRAFGQSHPVRLPELGHPADKFRAQGAAN